MRWDSRSFWYRKFAALRWCYLARFVIQTRVRKLECKSSSLAPTLEPHAQDVREHLRYVSADFVGDGTPIILTVCGAKHSPPFPQSGGPSGQDFRFAENLWDFQVFSKFAQA